MCAGRGLPDGAKFPRWRAAHGILLNNGVFSFFWHGYSVRSALLCNQPSAVRMVGQAHISE